MSVTQNKKLDPRLRRLAGMIGDAPRLNQERARGNLRTMNAIGLDELVAPEQLLLSVLIILRSQHVPEKVAHLNWVNLVDNIYSVDVPVSRLDELAALDEVVFVEAAQKFTPDLDTSVSETRADTVRDQPANGGYGLDGRGVIVGIIDSNFDFTLDDFRNQDGTTRLLYFWNQRLTANRGEKPPRDLCFNYGVEYDADAINQALSSLDPFSIVRNTERHAPPSLGGHGTHVAGIAAGNGRSGDAEFPVGQYVGVAPGATLIFVQPDSSDAQSDQKIRLQIPCGWPRQLPTSSGELTS